MPCRRGTRNSRSVSRPRRPCGCADVLATVPHRGGPRRPARGSDDCGPRQRTAGDVLGVASPGQCQILPWSGTSPACLVGQSIQMPEELVIIVKPLDTSGSQVCLGLAELFLPGWAVDPGILLGNDAGEPPAVADEHRGDMTVGGHVDQLWEVLTRLGGGHLLDFIRQRHCVLAHAPNVHHVRSVPSWELRACLLRVPAHPLTGLPDMLLRSSARTLLCSSSRLTSSRAGVRPDRAPALHGVSAEAVRRAQPAQSHPPRPALPQRVMGAALTSPAARHQGPCSHLPRLQGWLRREERPRCRPRAGLAYYRTDGHCRRSSRPNHLCAAPSEARLSCDVMAGAIRARWRARAGWPDPGGTG